MEKSEFDTLTKCLVETFGRDVVKELSERMDSMSKEELKKLVLIGCNQIGCLSKQGMYQNTVEAVVYMNIGAEKIITAYDSADLQSKGTIGEIGST